MEQLYHHSSQYGDRTKMKRPKSLDDLCDYLEKLEKADELLGDILFNNRNAVEQLNSPTYRKLQDYFNINEDE